MDCLYCRPWKSSRASTLWALFTQEQAGIHLFSSRLTTYDLDVKHVWRYHGWFVKPNSSEKRFLSPRLGSCPQPPDDRWDPLTVADTRGGEGGRSTPNNFSWSLYSEKWNHKEVFILRKRSTMTTTNNQHNRTKWHCLKTNKKQYSKFLILWGSMPPHPQRRLVPSALAPQYFLKCPPLPPDDPVIGIHIIKMQVWHMRCLGGGQGMIIIFKDEMDVTQDAFGSLVVSCTISIRSSNSFNQRDDFRVPDCCRFDSRFGLTFRKF